MFSHPALTRIATKWHFAVVDSKFASGTKSSTLHRGRLHSGLFLFGRGNRPRDLTAARMPSTVIRSFEYDTARHELHIVFQSGRHYIYQGVPAATADAMKRAFSKGEYFNQHIRDQFPFVRG